MWLAAAVLALLVAPDVHAQGLYLPGGGAAHLSMGGASTATPVDAIGALYWNPAAIGRLGHSEVGIGGSFLFPDLHINSGNLTQSGTTRSDSGVGLAPDIGVVYQPDDGRLTYGLGLLTIGGGGVNYPGDVNNPVLAGIGPLGNAQGPIYSNFAGIQITPTVAYKVTDRLVFGLGPMVDIVAASFDPAYFGTPTGIGGVGQFPTGTHSRPFWGGGVRAGLVYSVTDNLDIGFGYTSPQWLEKMKFYARTATGVPETLTLTATLPAIYSWGIAYRPTDRLLLELDLRYLDYKSTDLFGTRIVDGGLGWRSVFAAALGGRYQVTDRLALSAGYVYNQNPIQTEGTLFNIQLPAITEHTITLGGTMNLTDAMALSLGYAYGFRNSISGPVKEAAGVGVSMASQVQQLTFALQFKFGGCGCNRKPVTITPVDCPCSPPATPRESYPGDPNPNRLPTLPGQPMGG
jgi:long-chain fatty acid transport protein